MSEDRLKELADRMGSTQSEKDEILKGLRAARDGRDSDLHASVNRVIDMNKSPYRFVWLWGLAGFIIGLIIAGFTAAIIIALIAIVIGFAAAKK